MTALNRHFFAISLFISADLLSWRHLCIIVWICCFPRNLFAASLPVVLICLIRLASFHPLESIVNCCLRFENRVFESLVCLQNPMCDLLDFEMRLWKSILNRKSSVDVKRGIRCDGLTGFMHRVRKSDVWSDNAHFIFVQIRCGAAHLPGV